MTLWGYGRISCFDKRLTRYAVVAKRAPSWIIDVAIAVQKSPLELTNTMPIWRCDSQWKVLPPEPPAPVGIHGNMKGNECWGFSLVSQPASSQSLKAFRSRNLSYPNNKRYKKGYASKLSFEGYLGTWFIPSNIPVSSKSKRLTLWRTWGRSSYFGLGISTRSLRGDSKTPRYLYTAFAPSWAPTSIIWSDSVHFESNSTISSPTQNPTP